MSIHTRTERATGATLTIGTALELGTDPDGGKWTVLCERHSTLVNVETRALALTVSALDFCDDCREIDRESTLSPWQVGYQSALADVLAQIELYGKDAGEDWVLNNRMHAASGIFRRARESH